MPAPYVYIDSPRLAFPADVTSAVLGALKKAEGMSSGSVVVTTGQDSENVLFTWTFDGCQPFEHVISRGRFEAPNDAVDGVREFLTEWALRVK